ncbi:centrosomal protein of 290 kDa-like [Hippocampus zosterae]|uniref:centrosomal protein of 290 kDa-like n=1 Tax=Hippocampus zosterae TaxID=109293 RepID=UPI00223DC246|nr:centrosomal protein of 290 kDa-like [Hippocampus zosterae]
MPAAVEWDDVKKLDPATLHERYKDELDSFIDLLTSAEEWEMERRAQEDVVHILRVFQALLKMKHQEATLAERLVEEQEKNENTLLIKVSRLEEELTYAGTGPENRFLRNEIQQLKGQLRHKEEMVNQLKKEIKREKKTSEKLFLQAESAEEDLKMLKRENTQLQQDVDFYHGELALKESDVSKEETAETQQKLILANRQLSQCMDELQQAEEEILRLKADNLRMHSLPSHVITSSPTSSFSSSSSFTSAPTHASNQQTQKPAEAPLKERNSGPCRSQALQGDDVEAEIWKPTNSRTALHRQHDYHDDEQEEKDEEEEGDAKYSSDIMLCVNPSMSGVS